MTASQIIYYFHPWKKFIIWDDMRKPGCDKSCTQRTNVLQQICCVRQVSGSRTKFCTPV